MTRRARNSTAGLVILIIATAAAGSLLVGGRDDATTGPPTVDEPAAVEPVVSEELTADATTALEELNQLHIAEPHADEEYDSDLSFGQRWADLDRNGCDTRNDILRRDLVDVVTKPGTHGCVVLTGTLHDQYTGETVAFKRKSEGYQSVQVDHLVPKAWAFAQGADAWSPEARERFANDPANLQVTTANQSKGDSGPAEWYVPNKEYRCTYAIRFVTILASYSLTIPTADHAALTAQLTSCTT